MGHDWQNTFRSLSRGHALVHPDAPAGGSGAGVCRRPPGSVGPSYLWSPVPHPDSPAGRRFNWQELSSVEVEQRFARALEETDCASNISHLRWLVEPFAGTKSFGLGACYGIAGTAQGTSRAALELAKLFVLGDLYEIARVNRWLNRNPKLETGVALLKITRVRLGTLIRELNSALSVEPGGAFSGLVSNLSADQSGNWKRLKEMLDASKGTFGPEAGKIFGGVLADVLMSMGTTRDNLVWGQYRSQVPELVRLSGSLKRFGWARAEVKKSAAAVGSTSTAERSMPPPRPVRSERPPEPEPDTFVLNADQAAIAAVQQEAARLGVPFCEECEKARLANLAQQAGSQE
jgi:hypothetical protein